MHTRESNDNYHISRPLSAGITICPEWMYFSNFYKWVNSQSNFPYLIQQSERICVEKDILIKNNKLYSPLTCCLVPSSINALVCIHSTIRGKYPLGVTEACNGRYVIAKWQNPITHQGEWSTVFPNTLEGIQKAFDVYKYNREKYISVCEFYQNPIDVKSAEEVLKLKIGKYTLEQIFASLPDSAIDIY